MSDVIRVSHGVWRPADAVADLAGQCAVLLSAMPPRSVIAGLAAARLHGLWLPRVNTQPIEVITPGNPRRPRELGHSRRVEVRARRRVLTDDEITVVADVPVTTVARTWCDLAERITLPDLIAAGDCSLRGRTTIADLTACVDSSAYRRGVRRARVALPLLDERSMSRPESHLRYALVAADLPYPEVNEPVYIDGEWVGVPDLHYPRARLALEYQGEEHAEIKRMRGDITRELDFEWRDWKVLEFGPREVFGRPDQVASLVRRTLQQRDPGCLTDP
jgi:very-short-patch-repair endonuclease